MDDSEFLSKLYEPRFKPHVKIRNDAWKIFCEMFFQKIIPPDSVVVDIASGYGEFINNIKAKKKFAIDLNQDSKTRVSSDVTFFLSSATSMPMFKDSSVDVVFVSNFLEHLTKDDIKNTLKEINRILRKGGSLIVMSPNIRYCYDIYWTYFDHITPLDDHCVAEVIQLNNFRIVRVIPRFLPFSFESPLPKSLFLVRLYMLFPLLWNIFGKQFVVYAKKI